MPSPASTMPTASNGSGRSARRSSMKSVASTMPAIPIGILMRKIQCQVMYVVMKPPSAGPISGPTSAGIVTQTMALISSRRSTVRTRIKRPTGVIIAPPMPWKMRATTKCVSDTDSAQPIDPSMNTAIALRNTMRAPKRSAVQPLTGMKTASESRYEVTASLSASGLVPISAAIAGSDVAITVESMFSMNRATATISGTMGFAVNGAVSAMGRNLRRSCAK